MRQIKLICLGLLVVTAQWANSQDRNGYIELIAGSQHPVNQMDGVPVMIASGHAYAEVNSYLELKKGVSDGITEPEYESRFEAFGVSNEELGKMIIVHPNPVVDRFHLKIPREIGEVTSAGIYSMEGTKVRGFGNRLTGKKEVELEMDASDLIPGMYFIRIETDFGKVSRSFTVN